VHEIVIEIVIEIDMEQTRLFQCNRLHHADFRDWNRDWFFWTSSVRFKKVMTEIDKKINQRTNTKHFYVTGSTVQKSDFFGKWPRLVSIIFSHDFLHSGTPLSEAEMEWHISRHGVFWATVCKSARPMLSDRCLSVCLSVLSVCNGRALRPNGCWTVQDETWRAGRPRPWPHCVRCGPSYPRKRAHPLPRNIWPMSIVAKWLDGWRRRLVRK